MSSEMRRAVEHYAVARAMAHFKREGWTVEDVGARESFDLLCKRGTEELHVEVKGTSSRGESYVLTRNEVAHAHNQYPRVALYCVRQITILGENPPRLTGGSDTCFHPWDIRSFELEPLTFEISTPSTPPTTEA